MTTDPATASGIDVVDVDGLVAQVHAPAGGTPRGTVLLVPPYGVSADSLFLPAYVLAQNDFRVVRFDPRNHVGRSPGPMYDYRMSTVVEDVRAILEWAPPDVLVGFSLAGPAVFRALAESEASTPTVLAAGVLSMRYTLRAVIGLDLFGDDEPSLHQVVLGEDVNGVRFIADCQDHRMVSLEDSLADLGRVRGDVTLVAGTDDPWVDFDEAEAVAEHRRGSPTAGGTRIVPVEVGTHQFNLNPRVALTYTKHILEECITRVGGDPSSATVPPLHTIIRSRKTATASATGSDR